MRKIGKKAILGLLVAALFVMPISAVENNVSEKTTNNVSNVGCYLQPTVEWEKTYGGDEFDHFHWVRQTDDGGYIASGVTEESDMYYAWLLKLDADGNEDWRNVNYDLNGSTISNDMWVGAFDVIQTADGGYITCGVSTREYEHQDGNFWAPMGCVWKTDDNGNTDWVEHYYGITEDEEAVKLYYLYSITEVDDGFVIVGTNYYYTTTGALVDTTGHIMKIDTAGTLQWEHEYDETWEVHTSSIAPTSDGGFILGGFTVGTEFDGQNALLMVKTDGDGVKQWDSSFDGPKFEYTYGKGFCQTDDGGYIMNGVSNSYGAGQTDLWIIKTDASGNMEWDKTFGGTRLDYCWSMCSTDDGGYAFGVCKNWGGVTGTKDDVWIIKTDADGNAEWKLLMEEEGTQITRCISATDDDGFIVAAMTGSMGSSKSDGVLMKLSAFDNNRPDKPAKPSGSEKGKTGEEYAYTTSTTDADGDQLYYMFDWGDGNYSEWLGPYNSGDICEAKHTWSQDGSYSIKVMSKDAHDGDSDWSDPLPVSMPKTYENPLWTLIEKFFDWLEYILGMNILQGLINIEAEN